mmetsp:Transcript_10060/g.25951  ORF Transcript_10060/g.25951 Transcript_10060/m.25951 type:complete len:209 (+) Transcript_10060:101-727(+)
MLFALHRYNGSPVAAGHPQLVIHEDDVQPTLWRSVHGEPLDSGRHIPSPERLINAKHGTHDPGANLVHDTRWLNGALPKHGVPCRQIGCVPRGDGAASERHVEPPSALIPCVLRQLAGAGGAHEALYPGRAIGVVSHLEDHIDVVGESLAAKVRDYVVNVQNGTLGAFGLEHPKAHAAQGVLRVAIAVIAEAVRKVWGGDDAEVSAKP